MLVVLNIKNFALIQELSVEFGAGFNILSGETGAGKSILIDTIDYVLGGKFSKDLIRYGEDKTYVEAIFDIENDEIYTLLNDLNIEADELLVVSRETTISGKSIIKVNGKNIIVKTGSSVFDFFNLLFNPAGEIGERVKIDKRQLDWLFKGLDVIEHKPKPQLGVKYY